MCYCCNMFVNMYRLCFVCQDKVSAIGMFANLDLAEGVLDAVMQVIMCTVCNNIVSYAFT